ncbi:unnamed protein product [Dibothriocephalus latus]|uniref:BPTI/Kunitz inhibitor domain-containing protein n=1 Tax=Dibothriocephalus latus TaxID=60516 RepID=A0A3P7RL43_DIBLA|nr:unnamed protein product [Dibothriocephalus latus]
MPKESGMCLAYMPRFYFDVSESTCKPFIFGGCGGNANNFKSYLECERACGPFN